MNEIQQVAQHPLEKMQNMAERVTLPGSGIEVVVRRGDIEAITQDAMRFALNTGTMQEVAAEWAKAANEHAAEPGGQKRQQAQLSALEMLDVARKTEAAVIRAVVAAPPLDDLIAAYGGSAELPDLGLGTDYAALKAAVDRLNPTNQEQDKSPGEAVSASSGRRAGKPR